jgi:hypothetical protein
MTAGRVIVTLRSGRSERGSWEFEAGTPTPRICVGSSSLCEWRIHARGVRAKHVYLRWDGQVLSIQDQVGPRAVLVDGHPVGHRCDLMPRAELRLGEAVLMVAPAERATTTDAEATVVEAPVVEAPVVEAPVVAAPQRAVESTPVPVEASEAEKPEADPDATALAEPIVPAVQAPSEARHSTLEGAPSESSATFVYPAGEALPAVAGRLGAVWRRARVSIPGKGQVTRIGVVAVVAVCVGGVVALVGKSLGEGARSASPASATSELPAEGSALRDGENDESALRDDESALRDDEGNAVEAEAPDRARASASVGGDGGAPEPGVAAEHLLEGRQVEALAAFRRLARVRPTEPIFADVARILEREIGERCAAAGGGRACAAL